MSQHIVSTKSKKDIDSIIDRVLRDLGTPEPPLELAHVRELLRLDRQYYSSTDPSIVKAFVSKVYIAGQQLRLRPMLLLDAIKHLDIKALYIPDGKRILIDDTQPKLKHRWNESHEISHTLIPWHDDTMFGDTEQSLSPAYHAEIEAEANYSSGRLLFLGDRFIEESRSVPSSISNIKNLALRYRNTITSTLWRHVESTIVPAIAIISGHPVHDLTPFSPTESCKHTIYSPAFVRQFGLTDGGLLLPQIASYCSAKKGGPLGSGEIIIPDLNRDAHLFAFETFFNRYQAISLGIYIGKHGKIFAI